MLNEIAVHSQLDNLRDRAISLADFDRWIMSVGWNLHKKAPVDSRVYSLVRDIQGYISEYQHGEYSESELRQELFSLVPPALSPVGASTGFSNVPVRVWLNFSPEPFEWPITTSVAHQPRWFEPVLAEL